MKRLLIAALAATTALTAAPAFAGSKKPEQSNPHREMIKGAAPEQIVTPVDNGYTCFARYTSTLNVHPVLSVGRLTDQTGKFSNEAAAGGFEVTQGLSNEVYSALGQIPGVEIAERSDLAIVDNDITLAGKKLLADPRDPGHLEVVRNFEGKVVVDPQGRPLTQIAGVGLRDYKAGQMLGVDYFIAGAITGINYNIYSGGAQFAISNIGPGHRVYAMQIEMDLRIVDARTLRVIKTVAERKKIVGYETTFGIFSFLGGDYLFDINAGKKAQEPVELGVRTTMASAMLKLVGAVVPTADGQNYGQQCAAYGERTYGDVRESVEMPLVPSALSAQMHAPALAPAPVSAPVALAAPPPAHTQTASAAPAVGVKPQPIKASAEVDATAAKAAVL